MAFKSVPGLNGKVFVPESRPAEERKHDCPDCQVCQVCSEDRCALCRKDARCRRQSPLDRPQKASSRKPPP